MTAHGADLLLGREGYQLDVTPSGVLIRGGGAAGMFYGTQTLLQLLPPRVFSAAKVQEPVAWTVPAVRIKDRPRFVWRGLLLDVARHFFSKEELKNFIDLMAQHKLNTLQIHFTDDQGWRLEIKRYPKLAEVGGWRKSIGFGLAAKDGTAYGKDGRYGGFYTQDDIRELVAYAKARYVTIVPEIEMPGHSGAALSAYPEYSCFGGPYDRDSGPMGIYCPGNDAAFTFLQNVLSEVIGLFPGKYIHIGGDEVDQGNWTRCPKCKARIKQEGLKNEHELQSYFVKRVERHINAQGRTLIGWDEILEGGLAPNATVMSWRGIEGGVTAAKAGHDVIMTPTSNCYLDYLSGEGGRTSRHRRILAADAGLRLRPPPARTAGGERQAHPRGRRQPLERVLPQLRPGAVHGLSPGVRHRRTDVDRSQAEGLERLQTPHPDATRAAEGSGRALPGAEEGRRRLVITPTASGHSRFASPKSMAVTFAQTTSSAGYNTCCPLRSETFFVYFVIFVVRSFARISASFRAFRVLHG